MARRRKAKSKGGRPCEWLRPEFAFALGLALGRNRCWTAAAREAGVGKSTRYRWYRLGESADARFAPLVASDSEHGDVRELMMSRPVNEVNRPRQAALNGRAGGPHARTSLAARPDRALQTASLRLVGLAVWSDIWTANQELAAAMVIYLIDDAAAG
jgi:hypothetical protein